jgi:uncharacterized protein YbgA (DUF1722 family)/uncharacterized protein YbbK (DUF523 family)
MEERALSKIKVGISACLLGENVRYDGGHKLDRFLRDTLSAYVEWVPVCPEVECGLPTPREAMRLVGKPDAPRLVTIRTKIDHTDQMHTWAEKKLKELDAAGLAGFIFKSGSPSSGMERVKVYAHHDASAEKNGVGLFARAFMEHFPNLPVEDDGRLHDPVLRENFIERIFVFQRWQSFVSHEPSLARFGEFHAEHKLLIMAHSPARLRELGLIVAHSTKGTLRADLERYHALLMQGLKLRATPKKNTNVLEHCMGYFKKVLTADEKKELRDIFQSYYDGFLPLIVPIVLLKHYARKYPDPYLVRQYYLNPHPTELMLRTHV